MNMSIYTTNEIADFIIDYVRTIKAKISKTKLYLAMYYAQCIYAIIHETELFSSTIITKRYNSQFFPCISNEHIRLEYTKFRADIVQIISTNPDNIVYKNNQIMQLLVLACTMVNIEGATPSIILEDLNNPANPIRQFLKDNMQTTQIHQLCHYYKSTIPPIIRYTCRDTFSIANYAELLNSLPNPRTLRMINDHFYTKEHKPHSLSIRILLQEIAHNPRFHERLYSNQANQEYFAKCLEQWPDTIYTQITNGRATMPIPQFIQKAIKALQDRDRIEFVEQPNVVYV